MSSVDEFELCLSYCGRFLVTETMQIDAGRRFF